MKNEWYSRTCDIEDIYRLYYERMGDRSTAVDAEVVESVPGYMDPMDCCYAEINTDSRGRRVVYSCFHCRKSLDGDRSVGVGFSSMFCSVACRKACRQFTQSGPLSAIQPRSRKPKNPKARSRPKRKKAQKCSR